MLRKVGRSEESAKEMVKGWKGKGRNIKEKEKKMVAYKRGKRRKKQTGDFKRDQKDQIRKGRLERERESDE